MPTLYDQALLGAMTKWPSESSVRGFLVVDCFSAYAEESTINCGCNSQ